MTLAATRNPPERMPPWCKMFAQLRCLLKSPDMASMIRSHSFMREIPLAAIKEAAGSVYQAAIRTPLVRLELPFSDDRSPAPEIYLKLELLQPIGSFKIRGAWNAVRALSPETLA